MIVRTRQGHDNLVMTVRRVIVMVDLDQTGANGHAPASDNGNNSALRERRSLLVERGQR